MKLLVLVSSSHGTPYDQFIDNWRAAKVPSNVKIYYYFLTEGIEHIEVRNGDEIHIPGHESIENSFIKMIAVFKYVLPREEFDVVLRPGLSSAFHFPKLLNWLSTKPMNNQGFGNVIFNRFMSGCGFALTRDVVERLVNWTPIGHFENDDVMLGNFMREKYVAVSEWFVDYNRPVTADVYTDPNFHLRFKTSFDLENRIPDTVNHRKVIEHWNKNV